MVTRRAVLGAGGVMLAGLFGGPFLLRPARGHETVDIYLRSDLTGGQVWYDPIGVQIDPGQTIRWIAAENVHTATAYHPANGGRQLRIPAGARPWDSGYLVHPGDSFEVTLDVEGVYDYFCLPHEAAGMVGRIVVGDPARSPVVEFDTSVPPAARGAFPSVEQIMQLRTVRR